MTVNEFIGARFGTVKVTGTTEVTGSFQGFRVDEPTVVAAYKVKYKGQSAGVLQYPDVRNYTASVGLQATELQRVADGEVITSITLTSGSVTMINSGDE